MAIISKIFQFLKNLKWSDFGTRSSFASRVKTSLLDQMETEVKSVLTFAIKRLARTAKKVIHLSACILESAISFVATAVCAAFETIEKVVLSIKSIVTRTERVSHFAIELQ